MSNKKKELVCFGEVLWDIYPEGKKLGGAPFNVAAHLQKLGANSSIISRVGNDNNGSEIRAAISAQNIDLAYIQIDDDFATGVVKVRLDNEGKPTYTIESPAAWDHIDVNAANTQLVENADAFIFGSLACRSAKSRKSLFDLASLSTYNICDLNIRLDFYDLTLIDRLLHITHLLKINDDEAALLCEVLICSEPDLYPILHKKYGIKTIVQTKGDKGAEASEKNSVVKVAATNIKVVDTVGAGDAFFAAFLHTYLQNQDLRSALGAGCKLGAYVATQHGAIPNHPKI